jgi:hypothetical protein
VVCLPKVVFGLLKFSPNISHNLIIRGVGVVWCGFWLTRPHTTPCRRGPTRSGAAVVGAARVDRQVVNSFRAGAGARPD